MADSPLPPVEDETNSIEVDEVTGESENESDYEGGELFKLAERMLGNVGMETDKNDSQLSNSSDHAEMSDENIEYDNDCTDNYDEEPSNDTFQHQSEFNNEYSYSTEDTSAYMSSDSNYLEEFETAGPSVVANQMQEFYYEEESSNHTYSLYIQRFTQFQAVAQMTNEAEQVENEENEEDILTPEEHGEFDEGGEGSGDQMEVIYRNHDDESGMDRMNMPDFSQVSEEAEFANECFAYEDERVFHESFNCQSEFDKDYLYSPEDMPTYTSLEAVNFDELANVGPAEVLSQTSMFYHDEELARHQYSDSYQFEYNYPEYIQHMRYYEEEQNENVVDEDEETHNEVMEEEDIAIPEERDIDEYKERDEELFEEEEKDEISEIEEEKELDKDDEEPGEEGEEPDEEMEEEEE